MSVESYIQATNPTLLAQQIAGESYAAKYSHLEIVGDHSDSSAVVSIIFSSDLDTGEKSELDTLMAAHSATALSINQKIGAARLFGIAMIDEYQAKMIAEGITVYGDPHAMHVKLERSLVMAQAGNMYALDTELASITPTITYLEQSRIDEMRDKVRAYLSLPLLWDSSTTYKIGDKCHLGGTDYQASAQNTNDTPPSANWTAL